MEEATDYRVTDTENQLDGFVGLETPNHAGQDAKHTAFGAAWDLARLRWFGEKTTIAGTTEMGGENCNLAFKPID